MSYTEKTIGVTALYLDTRNPRFSDGVDGQSAAVAEILSTPKKERELLALARSIADQGGLDPSTLPVVTEENRRMVVLEGNRRITALKLLLRPDLAPTETLKKQFERISSGAKVIPGRVRTVVYDSREEYDDLLRLRHTGENDGAGLKPWRSTETARFRERQSGTAAIHTALLAWCDEQYAGDEEMLGLVDRIRAERLTTLKRVLMKKIRADLGLVHARGTLTVEYTAAQLRPFLRQLFMDILDGKTPDNQPWSRAKEKDVVAYVQVKNWHLLPDASQKTPEAATRAPSSPRPEATHTGEASASAHEEDQPRPVAEARPPSSASSNDTPPDHILDDINFDIFGRRIAEIGKQAQALSITRSPDVCAVLLRVLLDLTSHRLLTQSGRVVPRAFDDQIRSAIRVIDPEIENRSRRTHDELVTAYGEFGKNGDGDRGFAALRLHDMVHSASRVTTPSEVRLESQRQGVVIKAMEEYLRQAGSSVAIDKEDGHS